jgi:hypothetical protein
VNYRAWLEEQALRQMGGLPDEALDTLARVMARICEHPYDRLLSVAVCETMTRPTGWPNSAITGSSSSK